MNWKYKPNLVQDHHFYFSGKTYITRGINEEIDPLKIVELIHLVRKAALENKGIDYLQKLTEITTGKVVWILDGISDEEKERLRLEEKLSEEKIEEYDIHTILFPKEY